MFGVLVLPIGKYQLVSIQFAGGIAKRSPFTILKINSAPKKHPFVVDSPLGGPLFGIHVHLQDCQPLEAPCEDEPNGPICSLAPLGSQADFIADALHTQLLLHVV